jgi:hypothetical protein
MTTHWHGTGTSIKSGRIKLINNPYIMSAISRFLKVMNYDIMGVLADCLHNLNSVSYRTIEQRIFNLTL